MPCDWTEKVSLLVDGELAPGEAAAVEAHLGGCEECRAARGEFLFFRRQLGSFQTEANTPAQRRALAAILASKPAPASRGEDAARGGDSFAPAGGWRERLAAALGVTGLRPAAAASLAAVVLAGAVAFALYVNSRDETRTVVQSPPADAAGERAAAKPPPAATSPDAPEPRPEARRERGDAPGAGAALAAVNKPPKQ
ncbi:MAG TPA: zf-HC2 domain-containing protein, partial [Pyrinomonadaceae bacterium]|nr:zf-HC2 domain-containing protein [Pyrinomonadaceae bacterium]